MNTADMAVQVIDLQQEMRYARLNLGVSFILLCLLAVGIVSSLFLLDNDTYALSALIVLAGIAYFAPSVCHIFDVRLHQYRRVRKFIADMRKTASVGIQQ